MSPNSRIYHDRWRVERTVKDEPADVSSTFDASRKMMDEMAQAIISRPAVRQDMEKFITHEMAEVVFGSNQFDRIQSVFTNGFLRLYS